MVKYTAALVFGLILIVAIVGLIIAFSGGNITGEYSRLTVKYISCRYLDYDLHGACQRVERQEGTSCYPSQTLRPYWQGNPTGWFTRPCAPKTGTDPF